MKIIKASKKDIKEIGKLMFEEFSKPPFNEKVKFDSVLKSLKFYFKIGEIFIAKEKNQIMGVLVFKIEQYWEGKVIIIEDLAVKEEFKGRGVGKNLIEKLEKYSKENNIKRILLSTHIRTPALSFYKKIGFKITKDRISMSKELQ
jgi:ribosomal protein S18 acetylase RimI-like enzyme